LAVRISVNTMHDPRLLAATIALGGVSHQLHPLPHSAGAREPADIFVTVHGSTGDIVDARSRVQASVDRFGRTAAGCPARLAASFLRKTFTAPA
jgi:hypothetical protein